MPTPRLRLGQLLVDARLISAAALEDVLTAQRTDGRRLGTLLVERGLVNETQLTQILSHQLSVPWVSLLHIEFSRQLLNLVPREVADRYCLVPIYVRHVRNQGDTLYVAMDDPSNEDGLRACREHAGLPVRAMIAPPVDIRNAIRVYYGIAPHAAAAPVVAPPAAPPPAAPAPTAEPPPPEPRPEPKPDAAPVAPASADVPTTQREPGLRASLDEPARAVEAGASPDLAARADAPAPPADPARPSPGDEASAPAPREGEAPPIEQAPSMDGPTIEAVEIPVDLAHAERLRGLLEPPPTPPPPSSPEVENIPRPRGRAPRMVALTLLDGTTITLPAKRRARERRAVTAFDTPASPAEGEPPPPPPSGTSEPPADDPVQGLTARDLVLALRVVANGADASEVLGSNIRWEALFSALLSLLLKKHLIADWEFIDELKKQL